jgi:hypothetical protein
MPGRTGNGLSSRIRVAGTTRILDDDASAGRRLRLGYHVGRSTSVIDQVAQAAEPWIATTSPE